MRYNEAKKIKNGDRIKVAVICRYGYERGTRIVVEELDDGFMAGYVGIRFQGYNPFYVKPPEILEHYPQEII